MGAGANRGLARLVGVSPGEGALEIPARRAHGVEAPFRRPAQFARGAVGAGKTTRDIAVAARRDAIGDAHAVHALAALLGASAAAFLDSPVFRYAIGASFIAMAAWTLIPDTFGDDEAPKPRFGAFLTTLVAFFLVEMGDKTQVATIALGAQYHDVVAVTAGTTLGMMIANVPAIFLGHELLKRVDIAKVRIVAATLFLVIGIWVLAQTAGWLG